MIAIGATDPTKCNVYMAGGISIPCSEPAKDVIAKLQAASKDAETETKPEAK